MKIILSWETAESSERYWTLQMKEYQLSKISLAYELHLMQNNMVVTDNWSDIRKIGSKYVNSVEVIQDWCQKVTLFGSLQRKISLAP
jgi:hypothetical protein